MEKPLIFCRTEYVLDVFRIVYHKKTIKGNATSVDVMGF